jgi:hypothetical protein
MGDCSVRHFAVTDLTRVQGAEIGTVTWNTMFAPWLRKDSFTSWVVSAFRSTIGDLKHNVTCRYVYRMLPFRIIKYDRLTGLTNIQQILSAR